MRLATIAGALMWVLGIPSLLIARLLYKNNMIMLGEYVIYIGVGGPLLLYVLILLAASFGLPLYEDRRDVLIGTALFLTGLLAMMVVLSAL